MRLFGILVALVVVGCGRAPSQDLQQSALRLVEQSEAPRSLLFGELNGMTCNMWFRLSNRGGNEINVTVSSKSCSCVDMTVDKEPLQVGDSFTLASGEEKKIHLSGRIAQVASVQRFGCRLAASDGSSVVLDGSQEVYADTECVPTVITAPMPRGGGEVKESVEIVHAFRGAGPQPLSPAVAAPNGVTVLSVSPQGDAKQVERGLWRQTWRANFKVTPDAIAGGFAALRFTFDNTHANIPIKVTQAFGIAAPETITFGAVRVGEQRKRRVVMHAVDRLPFKVVKADADSPEVAVSVTESGEPYRYWIDIEFKPVDAGERRSQISIETTHPDSQRLAIATVGRGWQDD